MPWRPARFQGRSFLASFNRSFGDQIFKLTYQRAWVQLSPVEGRSFCTACHAGTGGAFAWKGQALGAQRRAARRGAGSGNLRLPAKGHGKPGLVSTVCTSGPECPKHLHSGAKSWHRPASQGKTVCVGCIWVCSVRVGHATASSSAPGIANVLEGRNAMTRTARPGS